MNYQSRTRRLTADWAVASRPDLAWLNAKLDADYARRAGTPVAQFWARPNPAEYLADLLIARLHEREAARMAAGEPNDNKAAFLRQELVTKTLADEADITEFFATLPIRGALPAFVPNVPQAPVDRDKLLAVLRTELQMK